jgi:hypothetical protein
MKFAPVVGLACTVDRPGYNGRYFELYKKEPWLLCKTAFSVVVERAAKYAHGIDRVLRVHPERCNKTEDRLIRGYYDALKVQGMPFPGAEATKYAPLTAEDFQRLLYEFEPKNKTSPMAQFADLFLWPICMGGYNASCRPYVRLLADKKLIECHLPKESWPQLASKYSCFENVKRKP